jgi:hypothetical protein
MILHLFKKVYLTFDNEINLNRQRLIFSEIHGNGMSKELNDFFFGKLHLFSHDIDELIGQDKQFSDYIDFFSFLNEIQNENDTRIFIYCDVNSYRKIICNWFKVIFEQIDANSAYKILEFNFLKRKLLATRHVTKKTLSSTSNLFDEMIEIKNNFESHFNSINLNQQKIISFYNNIKEYLSIEYLLASYLYNGQNKILFKVVLEKMINRMLEDAMKEIVLILFDIVMLKKIQNKMGLKEYNAENVLEIFEDKKFKDLIETNTWRFLDENGNFERVDFKKISLDKKDKIKESYKLILNSVYNEISAQENYEHNRINYMYYLNEDIISDENLNEIIQKECLFEMETTLWSNQDQESVNLFFTQYILEKYSENNLNYLNPYLLRN